MQGQVNGYAPGADGRPTRLPARFEWYTRVVSLPDQPLQTKKEAFIKIFHAGGDTRFEPATEADKKKYPDLWAAFERGDAQDEQGWSIDKAPFLDDAQARGYRELGIKTLEGLAEAHDMTVKKIMGGMEHRKKAQALLKDNIDKKPLMDALSQVEAQGKELAEMKAQMAQLMAQQAAPVAAVQSVAEPIRRGPGRPKASEISGLAPAVLPESDE